MGENRHCSIECLGSRLQLLPLCFDRRLELRARNPQAFTFTGHFFPSRLDPFVCGNSSFGVHFVLIPLMQKAAIVERSFWASHLSSNNVRMSVAMVFAVGMCYDLETPQN
jgi:hypothetical protein